jgi:hypothetical protein
MHRHRTGRVSAGGNIVQSDCGTQEQLWALDAGHNGHVVRNLANRSCLDVPGASDANGAKLIGWICKGGINQTWRYLPSVSP